MILNVYFLGCLFFLLQEPNQCASPQSWHLSFASTSHPNVTPFLQFPYTFVTFFHFLWSSHFALPSLQMSMSLQTLSLRTSPPSPIVSTFLFLNLPNLHFDLLCVAASTRRCEHCHLYLFAVVMNIVTSTPSNKMYTYKIILSLIFFFVLPTFSIWTRITENNWIKWVRVKG